MKEAAKKRPLDPDPTPDAGDIVWLDFNPSSGHEQGGGRPALVVTPASYNRASSLCFVLPITSRGKGYPFEVPLPPGLETSGFVPQERRGFVPDIVPDAFVGDDFVGGFVLADQGRTVDWAARNASIKGKVPPAALQKVRHLLKVLFVLE